MRARTATRVEGNFGLAQPFSLALKWRVGLLIGAAAALMVGLGLLTQWAAGELAYQPALGEPLFVFGSTPLYAPWSALRWALELEALDPASELAGDIYDGAFLALLVPFFGVVGTVSFLRNKHNNRVGDLHGSARFAEVDEIEEAGVLQKSGVFLGSWFDDKAKRLRYLRHDGPEPVIAVAPTRSGKGVGLVLPTLLTWPESTIVLDIKGENWALTAGFRHSIKQRVLKLDLASNDTVRFNPLAEIRIGTDYEVADTQALATALADPTGRKADGANAHWVNASRSLLTGLILHCLYRERVRGKTACIADLLRELTNPERDFDEALEHYKNFPHDPKYQRGWKDGDGQKSAVHPIVAAKAQEQLQREDKEAASVISTAVTTLSLFADPLLAKNTAVSDFTIDELMNGEQPVSLYLVTKPSDMERLKPIIRLILAQVMTRLTSDMEFEGGRTKKNYKNRLLLMLDEFPALGKLKPISDALPYMAGFGIRPYLITQDLRQLKAPEAYGQNETIVANCHLRVCYAPNDPETAKIISGMTGTTTVLKKMRNSSTSAGTSTSRSVSYSEQEVSRPLLTPDECMRLPAMTKDAKGNVTSPGETLVFVAGRNPIKGKAMLFWEDPALLKRSQMQAPNPNLFRLKKPSAPASGAPGRKEAEERPDEEVLEETSSDGGREGAERGERDALGGVAVLEGLAGGFHDDEDEDEDALVDEDDEMDVADAVMADSMGFG